jgi:hypothetical protein
MFVNTVVAPDPAPVTPASPDPSAAVAHVSARLARLRPIQRQWVTLAVHHRVRWQNR